MAAVLAREKPDLVLIEGPSDFNDRIDLFSLKHAPPVALFAYVAPDRTHHAAAAHEVDDAEDTQEPPEPAAPVAPLACFYPFAAHSPEWVALRAGIPAHFIDLPSYRARGRSGFSDGPLPASAHIGRLAWKLGFDDFDSLWDHLFECEENPEKNEQALERFFNAFRGDERAGADDAEREAFMVSQIAQRLKEASASLGRPATAVVVTGGFHTPALRSLLAREDARGSGPAVAAPPPPAHARVGIDLVPYSFPRLDALRGYASGMPGPQFYATLWEHGPAKGAEETLFSLVKALRPARSSPGGPPAGAVPGGGKVPLSPADAIALATAAEGLRRMRAHSTLSRSDLLDAVRVALVKEDVLAPHGPEMHPILAAVEEHFRGDRRGTVDPATPRPPLLRAVDEELQSLGLVLGPVAQEIPIDPANALDRRRAIFTLTGALAGTSAAAGSAGADEPNPYAPFSALVEHLLLRGVVGGAEAFATVASAVRRLDEARAPRWLVLAVAELVAQVDAYAHRSARYDAGRVAAIAGEIVGRLRAGTDETLGIGLPAETKVGRTRLLSLGARTFADGDDRRVEVTFVEPDSGTLILFEKFWDHDEVGEIARRPVLPRTPLGTLAEGQLITDAAVRQADGTVRFSVGRGAGTTSVLPQAGDWGRLSSRLVVRDFAAALRARTEGLPRFLGPRTRTETLAIVADFSVEAIVYVAEEQAILGTLVDGQGGRLFVRRRHAAVAPLALPILSELLPRALFLSGDLRAEAGRLVLDPLAVVADGKVHVLDTSQAPGAAAGTAAPVEVGPPSLATPLPANSLAFANGRAPLPQGSALGGDGRLDPLQRFVEDLVHGGLGRRRGAQVQAAAVAADALEGAGYLQIAGKIRAWARAPEDREAFFDLLVLAAVARES